MKYYVAIEPATADNPEYGAIIPELPGCTAQAETLDKAIASAQEAAELWIETAFDEGMEIPAAKELAEIRKENPEMDGYVWAVIDVDMSKLGDKAERVNITLPSRVLRRLDRLAQAAGETRSGYIAKQVVMAASIG